MDVRQEAMKKKKEMVGCQWMEIITVAWHEIREE